MKVDCALITMLLSGALAVPIVAQSSGAAPAESGQQPSASSTSSTSEQSSMPQSDQQADKSTKKSKNKGDSGSTSTASTNGNMKTVARKDRLFMEKAAAGGLMEVNLGNAVKDKAQSQDVKDFANKMVTDHGKANDELKALMEQKGLSAPTDVAAKDKSVADKITAKSGADLDKAYMTNMVKEHDKDIKEFQAVAKSGDDPDVKAWATKTLPTLEEHQKMANDIAQKVGAEGNMKHNHESKKEAKKESKTAQ